MEITGNDNTFVQNSVKISNSIFNFRGALKNFEIPT